MTDECFACGYVGSDPFSHSAHLSNVLADAKDLDLALVDLLVSHRLHLEEGRHA